jgi:type IV pilus assembly protein PilN
MRLKINLATQPYHDVRRMLFLWGFGIALVAIMTGALLWAAIGSLSTWRHTTRQMNEYRARIAACDRERTNAQAMLNLPENRSTRDQSLFINTLIARKAFSWTEVLSDLERIMPSGIHVVGITPDIKEDNQLELKLAAAGSSRDRAIELIRRMENSTHFSSVLLQSDVAEEKQDRSNSRVETSYRFEITAFYVPSYKRLAPDKPETATEKGGQ